MLQAVVALMAGLVFGLGLIVSGMGSPAKVQDFLDIFGAWDPSLALVMGGAIAVGVVAFTWAKLRKQSFLGGPIEWPSAKHIDRPLLLGAALFGIGWGMAGFCPAPALMNLVLGKGEVWLFVLAMLVGMLLQHAGSGKK